jgi:8-oxo-dGTP diphosphatase
MAKFRQRIACKAVIKHGTNILILREASTYKDGTNIGKFHLPGGRIEAGEPFLDGLKREIREETGLLVTIEQPFFVGEWFPLIRGAQNQIVAIFFVCTSKSSRVKLSDEHDLFKWINPKHYETYDLMEPEHEVIKAYLKKVGQA